MTTRLAAVGIRLDPKLRDQLQAQASGQHRTLSNWIAKILMDHCEATKKTKAHVNGHSAHPAKELTR